MMDEAFRIVIKLIQTKLVVLPNLGLSCICILDHACIGLKSYLCSLNDAYASLHRN